MSVQEMAKAIVTEDMGARRQMAFIKAQWDGCGLLDDFTAAVSEAVAALIGVE